MYTNTKEKWISRHILSSILTKAVNPVDMEHQLDISKTPHWDNRTKPTNDPNIYLKTANLFAAAKDLEIKNNDQSFWRKEVWKSNLMNALLPWQSL